MKQSAGCEGQSGAVRATSHFLVVLALIVLSLSTAGLAQELSATLTGTVTDSSGAVVAGATILVHSEDTGADIRTVTANDAGGFNITNLPAGRYSVTVSYKGFQSFVARGVILNVAEKHTLDPQLKAGNVSELVEVTAENTPIQTTTAEQSGTVTGDQVRELALSNRNFEQLVLLQPGVSNQLGDKPGFGLSSNTQISVNGARTGANNWTVDGADINDSGSNGTLLNTPGIDAIQEFTLERSNYDASFGRSGGGQVAVAIKSGTNQFHGSAYEFNRNNFYNANTFDNRATIASGGSPSDSKVPIERYNDFGFTLGGPLFIPKLWNPPSKYKTFFFWSEEWRKASTPGSNIVSIPTAAELNGTFATTTPIILPTGTPASCVTTSGNTQTIDPSCYSQNAAAYLNGFMAANPGNGNGTLTEPFSQLNNFRQDIIRVDQNVGDKIRVYGRFMQDTVPQSFPFGLWGTANYPGVMNTQLNAPGRNTVVNATATISPRVVNEVEFVDSWGAINSVLVNAQADNPSLTGALTNNFAFPDPYGRAPDVLFSSGAVGLGNTSAPYHERNKDFNLFDNLSIQRGNHTIRLGATIMWMTKTENGPNGQPQFTFSGDNGNPEFANFLLGEALSYTQVSKDTIPFLHYKNFEAYVQDDWKVTRKLSLNLGVRYSYFPSPTDSNDTLVNFDPNLFDRNNAPTIASDGTGNGGFNSAIYANGLIFPKGATCAAAQAISPTASCSPFGSLVNPNSNNNWGPRIGIAYDPFGNGKWSVRAGYGIFYDRSLNGIWEQNAFNDPPLVQRSTFNNTLPNGDAGFANLFDDPTHAVSAAAAPNTPNALTVTGTPTFKVPSYQNYNLSVQHEVAPNTVLEVAYIGTRGSHLLGDVDINQPTLAARFANPGVDANAIVPFAGFAAITSRAPIFTSNYNSLQVSLNRRFSQGLTAGVAYTWSKLLTTNPQDRSLAAQDSYNFADNYGASTLNTPQILVFNYVYDFPFYKNQHNALGYVLGGWELSGITNFQTGQSVTVTSGVDPFADLGGLNLGTRGSTAQVRADLVGDPHGPKSAAEFFNTSAFGFADDHFGNERPGTVLGPGFQLWDMSLIKNIQFAERVRLQLRLETFNTFNHGSPNGVFTNMGSPVPNPAPGQLPYSNASFGQISGWHDPRNVQIGAKINF
jgi:hypothetical protein